jgi:hypothetical protein
MKIYRVVFETTIIILAANSEEDVKQTLMLFSDVNEFSRIDGKLLHNDEECLITEIELDESKILNWTTY